MSSVRPWRSFVIAASSLALVAAACGSKNDSKSPNRGGYGADAGEGASSGSAGETSVQGGAADAGSAGSSSAGAEPGRGGAGSDAGGATSTEAGGAESTAGAAGAGGGEGDFVNIVPTDGFGTTGSLTFLVTTPQRVAIPGQAMLWNITVGNTSSVAVKGVNVMLRMPKGLQFYYTLANPASSACGNGTCSETEEATWDVGELSPGMTTTIQIDGSVGTNVAEGDTIAPLFRLQATGLDPLSVSKSVPVHPDNAAELTVSTSADPLASGDAVEVTVDVGNISDATLFAGKLSLTLPGTLKVLDVSDAGSPTPADGLSRVSWAIDSLPIGTTFRRSVRAQLRSGVVGGELLNPLVAFNHEGATQDLVAEYPVSVVTKRSPLVLRVEPAANPVVPNGRLLYDITVSNTSLRPVDGISLFLRVPPELNYYYTFVEPDSSPCGDGTCSNQELSSWSLGTLAAGTSQTVTVNANVLAATAGDGTLASTAFEVRAVGVNPLHAFSTVAVHTKPSAQMVLGTSHAPVTAGQTFTYELDVGQIGAGSLVDSELVLELPTDLAAGAVSDGGTSSGGVVKWSLGDVAVAGTLHRSVEVTVGAQVTAGSVISARAYLAFKGGQEVDVLSQHALQVAADVLPLAVTLTASANPTKLGDSLNFTTTIKNTSAHAIDGVQLLLRMPPGTSFYYTSADPDSTACGDGTCSEGEEAVWALGSIAAGATKAVLITPVPAATLPAGSLLSFRQRLTAVDLGGTILLESTLATKM